MPVGEAMEGGAEEVEVGEGVAAGGRGLVLHANVKGTKALNVISDMPCAKV